MQLSPHTAQSIPEISREESSSIIARIPSQEEPMAYGQ